jgi:HNH endonuclease
MPRPHFTIKNRFQKRHERYEDVLTPAILRDVCRRITGRSDFTVNFVDSLNVGRLAKLEYLGKINYISFSEANINGRNACFQSFPSALVSYLQEDAKRKAIFFYFLPSDGNIETKYFVFMYRLMKTVGVKFLNEADHLDEVIKSFSSAGDIIVQREANRSRNRANESTYVTLGEDNVLEIYGKTYGANKYETTLLTIALRRVWPGKMELYEIKEGDLKILPAAARQVIIGLGVKVIPSDLMLERREFEENNSLRSPSFVYNLLDKLGEKRCALCSCEIPQMIHGAHILPVATIKQIRNINLEKKLEQALDRDNGIWLCNNHHKLFDLNLLLVTEDGRVKYKTRMRENHRKYIGTITSNIRIPNQVLNKKFVTYLQRRNRPLDGRAYTFF